MSDLNKKECEEKHQKIGLVLIDEIIFNPDHPRKIIDDDLLAAIAETIKIVGILQPILVQKDEDEKIQLVAGEMRVRAAKMAGKTEIPAIFLNPKAKANFLVLSLIENIHKTHLTPLEEGEALYQLRANFRFSDRELNLITGKSKKEINELIEFNNLPDNAKKFCSLRGSKFMTKRKLRQLLKIEGNDDEGVLLNFFYNKQQRPRDEIVKDKALSLNRTLDKLKKEDLKYCGKDEFKTELKDLDKKVWEVLNF